MSAIPEVLSAATVLDSMSDGFVALDRDWRFTYVNIRGAEIQGRTPESLLGRKLYEV
jgi:PAS domain S-box-containing protein